MPMPISDNPKDYRKYFSRGKESTKVTNARRLKNYCVSIQKSPEQLIEEYESARQTNKLKIWERNESNRILKFYNQLLENNSINYARSCVMGVLAFHKQNTQQLPNVTLEVAPVQMAVGEYRFTQDDLRKMFYYGDTEEKALLSLAVSYGQGSKEFLSLKCQKLQRIINEAKDRGLDFVHWIGEARSKTSVQPISFLTPEAIESVDEYLQLLKKKHNGKLPKFLWCNSKPDKHITNEGLNKKLRRLVSKANIKTYGKQVRFHLIRKFTFSRLRRIDRDMAKVICAKSISASDMTYEEIEEQCEKVFRLAYKSISLNGDVTGKTKQKQAEEIKELENAIATLSKEHRGYRTTIEVLTKKIEELERTMKLTEEVLTFHKETKEFLKDVDRQLKETDEAIKNLKKQAEQK